MDQAALLIQGAEKANVLMALLSQYGTGSGIKILASMVFWLIGRWLIRFSLRLLQGSVGRAGSATMRNTRGLTRSLSALIVPPLPAPSRPANIGGKRVFTAAIGSALSVAGGLRSDLWFAQALPELAADHDKTQLFGNLGLGG
jgi:hypothetical protein